MSAPRRLPAFEQVAAARAALALSHRAHHAVHKLDDLVAAYDEGQVHYDAEAIIAEVSVDWAAYDRPELPIADRARAMRDAMIDLAKAEKEREDALEKLLYAQYHELQDAPELADIKAFLDPLYAERAVLYESLAPMWHELGLRRAGIAQVASMRELFPHASDASMPAQIVASAPTRRALFEAIGEVLPTMKIHDPPPAPPPDDASADAHLAYVAAFDAWFSACSAAVAADGDVANRDYARWLAINQDIEFRTG